jgi:NADPH:quinone reductase-like Zn-dependent oxidoreductase
VQIARALGAHVIALTTSENKIPLLKKYGAHEVVCVPQNKPNFTKEVFFSLLPLLCSSSRSSPLLFPLFFSLLPYSLLLNVRKVEPVDVVLELVGSKTFPFSLRCLKFTGRCVFVGNLDLAKVEVWFFIIFIYLLY